MSKSKVSFPAPIAGRWYMNEAGEERAKLVYRVGWSESGLTPMITVRAKVTTSGRDRKILSQDTLLLNQYKGCFKSYTIQPEGWEPGWFAGIREAASCKSKP